MRIHVLAVGRARGGPQTDVYRLYAGRLTPPPMLTEVEEKRPLPVPQRMAREAELLLAQVPEGATVVALDGKGTALDSAAFAERLRGWRDGGAGDLAFLIGGAEGLDDSLLKRADFRLSLGPMTWPHMLVRAMLAEQLYRAQSILSGHPYHR